MSIDAKITDILHRLPVKCLSFTGRSSQFSHEITTTENATKCTKYRAGLTIRGPHTNARRVPFSHTRTHDFLSRGALFFSQKIDDLFSRRRLSLRYTFKRQQQHSVVKFWHLIGGPLATGNPSIGVDLAGILGGRMARAKGGLVPSVVGYAEGCPLFSRLGGLGERRELPQRGPGRSPGHKRILAFSEGHRTLIFVLI